LERKFHKNFFEGNMTMSAVIIHRSVAHKLSQQYNYPRRRSSTLQYKGT
jgi:hypothetical protein